MKTHPFHLAIAGFVFLAVNASATVRYVDLNNPSPAPPYTDWSTAAVTIQDAIDAAADGDQILVTNGVYQTGGRAVHGSLTNRVAVDKALTVQSVNGPDMTVIQGEPLMSEAGVSARCVYLTNNAMLSGFTLTNGAASDMGDWDFDESGGGVWCEDSSAVVTNCIITGNSAYANGGGACGGTLVGCTLLNNWSEYFGGGDCGSALNNCALDNNYAMTGGGADSGTLDTCTVSDNTATWGGGINDCMAVHCTLTGNSSAYGGGADGGTVTGCTLSANFASNSGGGAESATLNHCTLSANTAYYGGGANNSVLSDCVLSNNTATAGSPPGFASRQASPQQRMLPCGGGATWSTLTDCTLAENRTDSEGGGAYSCTLSNCTLSGNLASDNGGGANGCTLGNCTLTGNSAVNDGGGADSSILNNCDLRGNWVGGIGVEASIKGSKQPGPTPNMLTSYFGGGAENCTLDYCTLIGNQVYGVELYAGAGGGADSSMLNNCIVADNGADFGGGAENSTLNNCTLTGNSAGNNFGGADSSTLTNCIVYYNTNGDYFNSSLNYCCTAQLPDTGIGNITNAPLFVDLVNGDFHLQSNSPCINSGNNSYVTLTNDLDGNPRIRGGTVDIGAYEYQTPTSVISYAWLQQYGLTNNGSADYADLDGDGFSNWNEWRAGTSPIDPSSLLKMMTVTNDVSGITVTWQSVSGVTYFLQRSTDLGAQPMFSIIQTDVAGQPGTTSYTDTDATGDGPYFYRVGVEP
jgi:hypothetical protein